MRKGDVSRIGLKMLELFRREEGIAKREVALVEGEKIAKREAVFAAMVSEGERKRCFSG